MVAEFDEACFEGPIGSVQGPIKTNFGYARPAAVLPRPPVPHRFLLFFFLVAAPTSYTSRSGPRRESGCRVFGGGVRGWWGAGGEAEGGLAVVRLAHGPADPSPGPSLEFWHRTCTSALVHRGNPGIELRVYRVNHRILYSHEMREGKKVGGGTVLL